MKTSKKPAPKFKSLAAFCLERDSALARVVTLWEGEGGQDEDEELTKALDVLAIAHMGATFAHFR
jgi:hypothetical protein